MEEITSISSRDLDVPDACWALIFKRVHPNSDWEYLSLVSKKFLSITNLLRDHLHVFHPSTNILSKLLQRFPHVKKISLDYPLHSDLNQAILAISQSGLDLEELDTCYSQGLLDASLEELGANMKNLKVLNCSNSPLADHDLIRIANLFPGLEDLGIWSSYCSHDDDGNTVCLTDDGILAASKNLQRLRKIYLSGNCCISDKSLVLLSLNCAFLERIELHHCHGVTENGISFILKNARRLNTLALYTPKKLES